MCRDGGKMRHLNGSPLNRFERILLLATETHVVWKHGVLARERRVDEPKILAELAPLKVDVVGKNGEKLVYYPLVVPASTATQTTTGEGRTGGRWRYYFRQQRDRAIEELKQRQVATGIHYPIPLHLSGAYQDLGYRRGDFPVAESAADRILSLPMYPELTAEMIDHVADSLRLVLLSATGQAVGKRPAVESSGVQYAPNGQAG